MQIYPQTDNYGVGKDKSTVVHVQNSIDGRSSLVDYKTLPSKPTIMVCEDQNTCSHAHFDQVYIVQPEANRKLPTFLTYPTYKQGKSEGFESCDRPIVRKRPIWVKIGHVLSRVTLKFDGWPWKTIGHLFFAVSSFVQHFIAIGEFKLELQSGNAQFGSKSSIFLAVWPCNLTYDLEKQ